MDDKKEIEADKTEGPRRRWRGSVYGGIWVVVVGVIFLLNNFGYFRGDAWGKLWPVFIIVSGLFIIFGAWR